MSRIVAVATAAASLMALGACTINTPPAPPPAPAPATTIITPPAPMAAPSGSTVVVPGRY